MALTEFDEGPLPADWIGELKRRGIEVVRDMRPRSRLRGAARRTANAAASAIDAPLAPMACSATAAPASSRSWPPN